MSQAINLYNMYVYIYICIYRYIICMYIYIYIVSRVYVSSDWPRVGYLRFTDLYTSCFFHTYVYIYILDSE